MDKIPKLFRLPKRFLLIILLAVTFLINGCWDRRELESLGLVQILGMDLAPDKKGVIVTTMIAIPARIGGGGQSGGGGGGGADGGETGVLTITMEAPTIYEAFNRINTTVNREITLIQSTALVIGEDLAKLGVRKWIDTLVRFREMRRTMLLFVCRGKAADIMKIKPKLEKNPSEYFRDLVHQASWNGMFSAITVNDFLNYFEAFAQENYAPLLAPFKPMETIGGEDSQSDGKARGQDGQSGKPGEKSGSSSGKKPSKVEDLRVIGTAIFNRAKMVGTFDIYESQILQLLTGKFREAVMTIADPKRKDHYISYRLLASGHPRIRFRSLEHGRKAIIQVGLNLEAEILSIQSNINYTTPSNEMLLGKHIAGHLKKRVQKVIKKAQTEYASDVFGFGGNVRTTFLTDTDWVKYHWPERFPEAKISVSLKVNIRRVGVQFQPPKMR